MIDAVTLYYLGESFKKLFNHVDSSKQNEKFIRYPRTLYDKLYENDILDKPEKFLPGYIIGLDILNIGWVKDNSVLCDAISGKKSIRALVAELSKMKRKEINSYEKLSQLKKIIHIPHSFGNTLFSFLPKFYNPNYIALEQAGYVDFAIERAYPKKISQPL